MNITTVYLLGFVTALIGVVPPGLLNMSAAKISIKEGHVRGVIFSLGVCFTVILQTYMAAIFARYINNHPEVVKILQRVAFVIFVLLSVYFLVVAKKTPKPAIQSHIKSKHSRFFHGVFLSALNVLPIPYQAYMTLTLASFGWLTFETINIMSYVAGAAMGTFVMLYVYIFFFDKIKSRKMTSHKGMNGIIGVITAVVALITLINIIKEW